MSSRVGASFAVSGSAWREITMDTDGMTIDQIAAELEARVPGVFLCHQCASEISDPELDGQEYVWDSDSQAWRPWNPSS
jgi:hypothetical protein